MATLSTYTDLLNRVSEWSQREDLLALVPNFIELAEKTIFRELPLRSIETSATGTTTSDTIAQPADCLSIERLEIVANGYKYTLSYTSPNGIEALTGTTSKPSRYTVENGNIRLISPPSSAYSYTLYYIPQVLPLSTTVLTNSIFALSPDVYLFGALMELSRYIMDGEMEAKYGARFSQTLDSMKRKDERQRFPISGGLQIKTRGAR